MISTMLTTLIPAVMAVLLSSANSVEAARKSPGLSVNTYGSCTMNGALAQCLGYDGKACRYAEYERCANLPNLRLKGEGRKFGRVV